MKWRTEGGAKGKQLLDEAWRKLEKTGRCATLVRIQKALCRLKYTEITYLIRSDCYFECFLSFWRDSRHLEPPFCYTHSRFLFRNIGTCQPIVSPEKKVKADRCTATCYENMFSFAWFFFWLFFGLFGVVLFLFSHVIMFKWQLMIIFFFVIF